MSDHFSLEDSERYWRRELTPAELERFGIHLAACDRCREQLAAWQPVVEMIGAIREELRAEASAELSHLTDEQAVAYVEDGPAGLDRKTVDSHLELCAACRERIKELREFQAMMMTYPPKEYAPSRAPFWKKRARTSPGLPGAGVQPQGAGERIPARPAAGPEPPGHTGLRFDWAFLAASTSSTAREDTGVFCEGALRATLWRDQAEVVLTLENDPRGRWQLNESGQIELRRGEGMSLAGELVHYRVVTGKGEIAGHLVLPEPVSPFQDSTGEVGLGSHRQIAGELFCRLASPADLTSQEAVRESILRARDAVSRQAWIEFARRHAAAIPAAVREVIEELAGS